MPTPPSQTLSHQTALAIVDLALQGLSMVAIRHQLNLAPHVSAAYRRWILSLLGFTSPKTLSLTSPQ